MIRFTLSADSSDELSRAVDSIKGRYVVHNVKMSKTVKNNRYRAYIFVTEKPGNTRY